jgi:hypothetical protein
MLRRPELYRDAMLTACTARTNEQAEILQAFFCTRDDMLRRKRHRHPGLCRPFDRNGAKISIAFVEDGGELHAFYDGFLSGMDKPWGGVSWLLARNG